MFVRVCFVVAACSLQLTLTVVPKYDDDSFKIKYPGPIQELGNRFGKPNKTDPCEGQNYCTVKPHDYPEELFNKLFKGKIKEPIFRPSIVLTGDRNGESEEEDNCDAKIVYEPIYQVRSDAISEWKFVAQAPKENFEQLVRIESCNEIGTSCFKNFEAPYDLEATCMQRYGVWEVLVKDENEGTKPLKVDLPSCCSCYYKSKT